MCALLMGTFAACVKAPISVSTSHAQKWRQHLASQPYGGRAVKTYLHQLQQCEEMPRACPLLRAAWNPARTPDMLAIHGLDRAWA